MAAGLEKTNLMETKRMTQTIKYLFCFVAAFVLSTEIHAAQKTSPLDVVKKSVDGMTKELKTYSKGSLTEEILSKLVKEHIQPAIDQRKIAMGAMGKYWRRANKTQQDLFIERFRALQIRTYTNAFASFTDGEFTYSNVRYNSNKSRAIVKTELKMPGQKSIPFDFKLYYNKQDQTWLIYSAAVAGLDLVKTYRDQVQSRLQKISMDELLEELKEN